MSPRPLAPALVALLTVVATTQAQVRVVREGDARLYGIREADVVVDVQSEAGECMLTRAAVQATARDALRGGGLTATVSEKARSGFYSLVVAVRSRPTGPACAASVATELVAEVRAVPEADAAAAPGAWGSILKGALPLVRESTLVIAAPSAHDATVQDTVRAHAAAIAARVRAANP